MWSEPFVRSGTAILLMDTQGMFDNETTMTLTAQIFGLSTFVSSFQIYNVDKRLQEDQLQHLALFSDYGRLAMRATGGDDPGEGGAAAGGEADAPAEAAAPAKSGAEDGAKDVAKDAVEAPDGESTVGEDRYLSRSLDGTRAPFQKVLFLVRDWQNFEADCSVEPGSAAGAEERARLCGLLRAEMGAYLSRVLQPRGAGDLQNTRDQIARCFERIDCFLLPHPGSAVTRRTFTGELAQVDPLFLWLVDALAREVFDAGLQPKRFHGREVGGPQLFTLFQVFVDTFRAAGKGFPRALTLLDASAEANNRSAVQSALELYETSMANALGADKPYVTENVLQGFHETARTVALALFDQQAGLGSERAVRTFRLQLLERVAADWERFRETNRLRNPYRDVEAYIIPAAVGGGAWITASLLDQVCTSVACEFVEDTFERVYIFVALACLAHAYQKPLLNAQLVTLPVAVAVASWFLATVISTACDHGSCQKMGGALQKLYLFIGFALALLFYKNYSGSLATLKMALEPMLAAAQKQ